MSDPLEVETALRKERLEPRAFRWRGTTYRPLDLGRHWRQASNQHWLVRTVDGQVFELIYHPDESRWSMGRTPADFQGGRSTV